MDIHDETSTNNVNIQCAIDPEGLDGATNPYHDDQINLVITWVNMDDPDRWPRRFSYKGVSPAMAEKSIELSARFATLDKAGKMEIKLYSVTEGDSGERFWSGAEVSPENAVLHFRRLVKALIG